MDKQSKRINNETIKFVNKTYEALSILKTQREDIRYFSYDHNDELIDETVNRMYELLDDMYHESIDKKSGWVVSKGNMKPKKLVFHDCKDTSPQTPEQKPRHRRKSTVPKRNNVFLKKNLSKIKVELIDEDKKEEEENVLETIMYSSEEESEEVVFVGYDSDGETEIYQKWPYNYYN